jgi:hypothetical protein
MDEAESETQESVQESDMRIKPLVGVRMSSEVVRSTPGMIRNSDVEVLVLIEVRSRSGVRRSCSAQRRSPVPTHSTSELYRRA